MKENNHAYLKLRSVIMKKDNLSDILNKYDKIEILKNKNTFKDKSIIRIIPYVFIPFEDFSTIIGCCKNSGIKHPLITGIVSSKNTATISYKVLLKLLELEKLFNINLSISKTIKSHLCNN